MKITRKFLTALLCALIVGIAWSPVALAQPQEPTADEMDNDENVSQAIEDAWTDSQAGDKDNRHEEGGWILQNIETGEMKVVRVPAGGRSGITPGAPPEEEGWRVVGFFHTHPNPPKDEDGNEWKQGPSNDDENWHNAHGFPGKIRNADGTEHFGPERGTYTPTP